MFVRPCVSFTVLLGLLASSPTLARADEPEAPTGGEPTRTERGDAPVRTERTETFEHEAGGAVDARLPLGDGFSVRSSGLEAPVAAGYRARRFALVAGPLFARSSSSAAACGPGCSTTVTRYGAQLRADLTVLRIASNRVDGYVPVTFALSGAKRSSTGTAPPLVSSTAVSGEASWSMGAGLGARYWLTRHLAVFSELTLMVADTPTLPVVVLRDNSSPTRSRSASVGGAVGAAFVF